MARIDPFTGSYAEARETFLAAAGRAGATLSSHRAPGTGPDGGPLHLDTALLGDPAAPKRLVVSSGLHGVEGYCGSACQIAWLGSDGPARLPADLAVLVVHALNPYGVAWVRRFNEDNVDLNRNFLGDFATAPDNPRYRAVRDALAAHPEDRAARAALAAYRAAEGEAAYVEAVSGGQYQDPQGIFYGGSRPCWTRTAFEALLRGALAGARRAVLFDIHTGIGSFAERVAFCITPAGDPRRAVAAALFGEAVRGPGLTDDGRIARRGLMMPYLDALDLAPWVLPIGVEFGTYPLHETIEAIRAENWLHHHGDRASAEGRRIVAALRHAFCPRDDAWEAAVLASAAEMFRRIIGGIAALPVEA